MAVDFSPFRFAVLDSLLHCGYIFSTNRFSFTINPEPHTRLIREVPDGSFLRGTSFRSLFALTFKSHHIPLRSGNTVHRDFPAFY
jgi:hypothetical protein